MRNLETASTVDLNERFWPHLFHLSNQGTLVNDWHKTVHIVSVFFFVWLVSFFYSLSPPSFYFLFLPRMHFSAHFISRILFFFDQIIILHLTTEHWYFKLKKLKKKHTETFLSQFHAINSFFLLPFLIYFYLLVSLIRSSVYVELHYESVHQRILYFFQILDYLES